jgi:hypothetical protein
MPNTKIQKALKNIWKSNNKQHKHPVPPKHDEEALKYMEASENGGTYIRLLRKLTIILSSCQEHA